MTYRTFFHSNHLQQANKSSSKHGLTFILSLVLTISISACSTLSSPAKPELKHNTTNTLCPTSANTTACPICATCSAPPSPEQPPKPAAKPLESARWADLPNWPGNDGLAPAFSALLTSCTTLHKQAHWQAVCTAARALETRQEEALRTWFEAQFQPWQLVNPDHSREGLITGYYEPIIKASRQQKKPYVHPIYAAPEDLITVDFGEQYPELKHMRLRGRLEGRRLVPYFSRAEWEKAETRRNADVLLWADDVLDVFFMQIQGSAQAQLDDGSRVRLNYADQNGHPYRSIGRWLIDQGELKAEQASMQGIRHWAKTHPKRLQELLNANPSYVFFRELALDGKGPPGAMGLALTPERSLAIDPKNVPLGVPIWLSTTQPNSEQALTRLMVAQDTGGAIRGVVRADFYWGSGSEAGHLAGKMRQKGQMWLLLPRNYQPVNAAQRQDQAS